MPSQPQHAGDLLLLASCGLWRMCTASSRHHPLSLAQGTPSAHIACVQAHVATTETASLHGSHSGRNSDATSNLRAVVDAHSRQQALSRLSLPQHAGTSLSLAIPACFTKAVRYRVSQCSFFTHLDLLKWLLLSLSQLQGALRLMCLQALCRQLALSIRPSIMLHLCKHHLSWAVQAADERKWGFKLRAPNAVDSPGQLQGRAARVQGTAGGAGALDRGLQGAAQAQAHTGGRPSHT